MKSVLTYGAPSQDFLGLKHSEVVWHFVFLRLCSLPKDAQQGIKHLSQMLQPTEIYQYSSSKLVVFFRSSDNVLIQLMLWLV